MLAEDNQHQQYYEEEESAGTSMTEGDGMPHDDEIEDYAKFLGMDINDSVDRSLLWIAKQGLLAPVPLPWQEMKDTNDNILYYNTKTKEQTHEHPCDSAHRILYKEERGKILHYQSMSPGQQEEMGQEYSQDQDQDYEQNSEQKSSPEGQEQYVEQLHGANQDSKLDELDVDEQIVNGRSQHSKAQGGDISLGKRKPRQEEESNFKQTEMYSQKGEEYQNHDSHHLPQAPSNNLSHHMPHKSNVSQNQISETYPISQNSNSANRNHIMSMISSQQQQPQIMQNQYFSGAPLSNYEHMSQNSLYQPGQFNQSGMENYIQQQKDAADRAHGEMTLKIQKASRERTTELTILEKRMKKAKREQINDLNTTMQFELQTVSKQIYHDIEADLNRDKHIYREESDQKMNKELQMARTNAEFEGERIRRRFDDRMHEERERVETFHHLELDQIKRESDSKIKLSRSRLEIDDDALFEAKNELQSVQEHVSQLTEDREIQLEKRRQLLKREGQQDAEQYRKQLQANHEAKLVKLKSKHKMNLEEQSFKLAKKKGEQAIRDETSKAEMKGRMLTQVELDQQRIEVETQVKLRTTRLFHEDMALNKKKEITQKLELNLQRRVNQANSIHYEAMRRAAQEKKEKYELIKEAELREIQNKLSNEFQDQLRQTQERSKATQYAYSAQEHVLKEIEQLRIRIRSLNVEQMRIRDDIEGTQLEQETLAQRLHGTKIRHVEETAKKETELQCELSEQKNQLAQTMDAIDRIKQEKKSFHRSTIGKKSGNQAILTRAESLQNDVDQIKEKVEGILAANVGERGVDQFQVSDLKKLIPSELNKVSTKISQIEKDLSKLKSLSKDINESLFDGLSQHESVSMFTKLNEFKQDINGERQQVEIEIMKLQTTRDKLKESRMMLAKMQQQLAAVASLPPSQSADLTDEFKNYLRRREEALKEPQQEYQPRQTTSIYDGVTGGNAYSGYTNRQFYHKESEWMRTNLRNLTLI